MEKVAQYRELIKKLISEYVELVNHRPTEGEETFTVFDERTDNYFCMTLGWKERKRIKYITLHVRIHNGKIWIEEDWTEEGVANELVRQGVPREDIVLAFHSPKIRQYTDFAAA